MQTILQNVKKLTIDFLLWWSKKPWRGLKQVGGGRRKLK
jgi:hypothetical protein